MRREEQDFVTEVSQRISHDSGIRNNAVASAGLRQSWCVNGDAKRRLFDRAPSHESPRTVDIEIRLGVDRRPAVAWPYRKTGCNMGWGASILNRGETGGRRQAN